VANRSQPWEVRSHFDHPGNQPVYSVERGTGQDTEVAAGLIYDYGLACLIEVALGFRDGGGPDEGSGGQ
jgi:hypothetical protein